MKNTITLDIETTGLKPEDSQITCICALNNFEVEFRACESDELQILEKFIEFLKKHPPETTMLITHNGRKFDIPFIIERYLLLSEKDIRLVFLDYEHFDSIEIVKTGKWLKLDEIADLYGLSRKSGNGLHAIELFKERKFQELEDYCMDDVYLTENVAKIYFRLKYK